MFVKFCRVKKACMGDGGEVERALDDVFGIWVTVPRCATLADCRLADLQTCRLADLQTCRLADLQTCRLADFCDVDKQCDTG